MSAVERPSQGIPSQSQIEGSPTNKSISTTPVTREQGYRVSGAGGSPTGDLPMRYPPAVRPPIVAEREDGLPGISPQLSNQIMAALRNEDPSTTGGQISASPEIGEMNAPHMKDSPVPEIPPNQGADHPQRHQQAAPVGSMAAMLRNTVRPSTGSVASPDRGGPPPSAAAAAPIRRDGPEDFAPAQTNPTPEPGTPTSDPSFSGGPGESFPALTTGVPQRGNPQEISPKGAPASLTPSATEAAIPGPTRTSQPNEKKQPHQGSSRGLKLGPIQITISGRTPKHEALAPKSASPQPVYPGEQPQARRRRSGEIGITPQLMHPTLAHAEREERIRAKLAPTRPQRTADLLGSLLQQAMHPTLARALGEERRKELLARGLLNTESYLTPNGEWNLSGPLDPSPPEYVAVKEEKRKIEGSKEFKDEKKNRYPKIRYANNARGLGVLGGAISAVDALVTFLTDSLPQAATALDHVPYMPMGDWLHAVASSALGLAFLYKMRAVKTESPREQVNALQKQLNNHKDAAAAIASINAAQREREKRALAKQARKKNTN